MSLYVRIRSFGPFIFSEGLLIILSGIEADQLRVENLGHWSLIPYMSQYWNVGIISEMQPLVLGKANNSPIRVGWALKKHMSSRHWFATALHVDR